MKCSDVQNLLPDVVDGTLGSDAAASVEAHLRECDACSSELRALKGTIGLLRQLDVVEPPPDLLPKIHARLAREGSARGLLRHFQFQPQARVALAAGVVVALCVYGYVLLEGGKPRLSQPDYREEARQGGIQAVKPPPAPPTVAARAIVPVVPATQHRENAAGERKMVNKLEDQARTEPGQPESEALAVPGQRSAPKPQAPRPADDIRATGPVTKGIKPAASAPSRALSAEASAGATADAGNGYAPKSRQDAEPAERTDRLMPGSTRRGAELQEKETTHMAPGYYGDLAVDSPGECDNVTAGKGNAAPSATAPAASQAAIPEKPVVAGRTKDTKGGAAASKLGATEDAQYKRDAGRTLETTRTGAPTDRFDVATTNRAAVMRVLARFAIDSNVKTAPAPAGAESYSGLRRTGTDEVATLRLSVADYRRLLNELGTVGSVQIRDDGRARSATADESRDSETMLLRVWIRETK